MKNFSLPSLLLLLSLIITGCGQNKEQKESDISFEQNKLTLVTNSNGSQEYFIDSQALKDITSIDDKSHNRKRYQAASYELKKEVTLASTHTITLLNTQKIIKTVHNHAKNTTPPTYSKAEIRGFHNGQFLDDRYNFAIQLNKNTPQQASINIGNTWHSTAAQSKNSTCGCHKDQKHYTLQLKLEPDNAEDKTIIIEIPVVQYI